MKKLFSVLLLGGIVSLSLVGCDNGNIKDDVEKNDDVVEVGKTDEEDLKLNESGLEVFEMEFGDSVKINPKISNEDLEKEEFILFTYSETCVDCVDSSSLVSEYTNKENSLPIYAVDFTLSENHEILDFLISKGLNFTNLPTFGYFHNGKLYKNTIGEFKLEDIPLKDDYKNLKVIESNIPDDGNNSHSHEGHSHDEEGHSHDDEEGHSHDDEEGHSHDDEEGHSHDEEEGHSH